MSKTILIVDDFASVRLYHTSFLKRKGYTCIAASDGADALALLEQHPVDLVLLDMVMPVMSGETFLDRLAALPARAGLPVLAITSEQSLAEGVLARAQRPMGVLSKPVMPEALLRGVQQLIG